MNNRIANLGKVMYQLPVGAVYLAGKTLVNYPVRSLGAVGATVGANYLLDNPIGGVVDATTFGLTNFRPNEEVTYRQNPNSEQLPPPGFRRLTSDQIEAAKLEIAQQAAKQRLQQVSNQIQEYNQQQRSDHSGQTYRQQ